ncbi:EAL and HDOD domain-containing protein [Photobacterium atrarenae]|uniref:HDOD domain-containing protein n=1 Tax=Photobacterium atrarenae TaxID=865757 RepID=A0ABY5GF61_9GAMM|nr:HDOD domain-containing protein [Photobacterium atrarenae]UTV27827.1 HDOD domain-containing protein [Photobacterium atrarenae]
MYSYVARQPIFNRKQRTVGYELLFRDGESNAFPMIEANKATCRLLVENYMAVGDNPATAGQRTFINFPHESLVRLLPLLLPKRKVIIEVLETCTPDEELFTAIKHLYRQGYVIALDDFELDPQWHRFLPYVHLIKLDFMTLGADKACAYVRKHQDRKLKFLAEKVETRAEFEAASEAGFHFFQGYYFSKPELMKNRQVQPEKLTTVRLLQEICREEVNFQRVEQIIASDVSLSYLLLRYVNTAAHRTIEPISSFRQALVYLGEEKLKMFVSAVATAHAAIDKPKELYALSLQRARMCEMLAVSGHLAPMKEKAFLTGMFSLLDALLDNTLAQILGVLPLSREVRAALLQRSGDLGLLLNLLDAYDRADWEEVSTCCQALSLSETLVAKTYQQAMQWSQNYLETSGSPAARPPVKPGPES